MTGQKPARVRLISAVAMLWAAVACAAVLAAQSPPLGEVARKEAERRRDQPQAGKVYTNKDLPEAPRNPAPPPDPPDAVDQAETAAPPATPTRATPATPQEVRNEAWWQARVAKVHDELRRNEVLAESLQLRINALARDFVSRDNPVQRARLGEERGQALAELAKVQQEIARGRTQMADIEEEARRAGVPPGWLR